MSVLRTAVLCTFAAASSCSSPAPDRTPPPSAGLAAPPSAAPAAPVPPAPIGIGPGEDTAPRSRPTPAESLAARPAWAEPAAGYAPQLDQRTLGALFGQAETTGVSVTAACDLLVCRAVHSGRTPDPSIFYDRAEPDLDIELNVGGAGPLRAEGLDDERAALIAAPLLAWTGDERIALKLVDRDSGTNDALGTLQGTFKGALPAAFERGPRSMTCRGLSRASVEAQIAAEVKAADESLTRAATDLQAMPLLYQLDLGFSRTFDGPRAQTARVAALAGWADPRVLRRLEWLQRLERHHAKLTAPVVAELAANAADSVRCDLGSSGEVLVSMEGVACGPAAVERHAAADRSGLLARWGCVLRLGITAPADRDLGIDLRFGVLELGNDVRLALADGTTLPTRLLDVEAASVPGRTSSERRLLPAGQRRTAVFVPLGEVDPGAPDAGRAPRLVLLDSRGTLEPLLLRVPRAGRR